MRKSILLLFILSLSFYSCKEDDGFQDPREDKMKENKELSNYDIYFVFDNPTGRKLLLINNPDNQANESYAIRIWGLNLNYKNDLFKINVVNLIENYYVYEINQKRNEDKNDRTSFYHVDYSKFALSQYTAIDSVITLEVGTTKFYRYIYKLDHTDTITRGNNMFIVKDY